MRLRYQISTIVFALASPSVALAAATTFKDLANLIVKIVNAATVTLVLVALLIYLFGVASGEWSSASGDERGKTITRKYLTWGILALFIMVSIWGILQLLQNTLFDNANYSPTTGAGRTAPSGTLNSNNF